MPADSQSLASLEMALVPESLGLDSLPQHSQHHDSQRYTDYAFEATQQATQATLPGTQGNSQLEPRRKYWAIFIPINGVHAILKVPWSKQSLQVGRGPRQLSGNDTVLSERRISNQHCRVTLGWQGTRSSSSAAQLPTLQSWKDGDGEPQVWIEDLGSSNGTFVNGNKLSKPHLLRHGDEVSLGHAGTTDGHDVRYIFRSVGSKGTRLGLNASRGGMDLVGAVYERYQLLDSLGKGTFAEVRKAVDVDTGDVRAIKQIVKHRFAGNAKTLNLFQREINISQTLEHENICQLIEWYEDPQHICLVLEYVAGGDLLDYIMNWPGPSGLPEDYAAELTTQICRAMEYTHQMGITHRDLKPENILITAGQPDEPRVIKIADFGLAKMVHAETMLTSMVGTPQYLAPEVVMQTADSRGYENVVDSWSVGIITYSMMTKALPFEEAEEMPVETRIRARFEQPFDVNLLHQLGISETAIHFVGRLLAKRPSERMTMTEALKHKWLSAPTSQESQYQAHKLSGESTWDIDSFEDEFEEDDESERVWDRPATISGTNLASSHDLTASRDDPASDDFSQPLHNLRLATPAMPRQMRGEGEPPSINITNDESPPSPPLTDEGYVPPINRRAAPLTPALSEVFPTVAPAAVAGVPQTLKRKLGRKTEKGMGFSSGSLSPPPEASDHLTGSPLKKSRGRQAEFKALRKSPRKSMRTNRSGRGTE